MKIIDNVKTGKRIMEARKRRGVTVRNCAQRLHVSEQAVYNWQTGKCLPSLEVLVNLGALLGLSFEKMLVCEERREL